MSLIKLLFFLLCLLFPAHGGRYGSSGSTRRVKRKSTGKSKKLFKLLIRRWIARTRSRRCGNGRREPWEECDDGNKINTDLCTNECKNARCGDGYVQEGVEECDDGNKINTDLCTNECKDAQCGDGYVQEGVEECDEGVGGLLPITVPFSAVAPGCTTDCRVISILCEDTCRDPSSGSAQVDDVIRDGECDDGWKGSLEGNDVFCRFGTDCTDCGVRCETTKDIIDCGTGKPGLPPCDGLRPELVPGISCDDDFYGDLR